MNDLSTIIYHIDIINHVVSATDRIIRILVRNKNVAEEIFSSCNELINLTDTLIDNLPEVILTYYKDYNKQKEAAIESFDRVIQTWSSFYIENKDFIDAWVDFLDQWETLEEEVFNLKQNGKAIYLSMN
jgi:hypothetical protein